jgi:predicted nuclease of predicted toxin-antitoxin system
MRLYLDDNSASPLLVRLLQRAGHYVQLPMDAGLAGRSDVVHLTHAIDDDRVSLTEDHEDFKDMHNLLMRAGGHHPGILVVRRDNDPKRDLKPPGVVRAIAKLLAAGVPLVDYYHVLNHWR